MLAPVVGKRAQQRLQKNSLWRPRAAKTPPKMEANLGFKNRFLGAQVGLHFGGGLGGQEAPKLASILEGSWRPMSGSQAIFLRPNMAPCWPHVSPQHEPMLDFQHGPMLEANMDLCWRPTWTHFGSQHGPIFCLQRLKIHYFQDLNFGASGPE